MLHIRVSITYLFHITVIFCFLIYFNETYLVDTSATGKEVLTVQISNWFVKSFTTYAILRERPLFSRFFQW